MRRGMVGIASIGYGYWGPNLLRNFPTIGGAEVIAVSDLDPEKLSIRERFHHRRSQRQAQAMLRDPRGTWPISPYSFRAVVSPASV
jgi:predicted dehydrogenase